MTINAFQVCSDIFLTAFIPTSICISEKPMYRELLTKVRDYQNRWRELFPDVKGSMLSESVAAGFGFTTHNALLIHIKHTRKDDISFDPYLCELRMKALIAKNQSA